MSDAARDRIAIRDLRVATRIGVDPGERTETREVVINLVLHADARRAGRSDDLADTVDYAAAATAVAEYARSAETHLLEHLAERIANILLGFEGVGAVTVEVEKTNPPIDADVRSVAITIERAGDDNGGRA